MEPHVDIQFRDEPIGEQQAAGVLEMVIQSHIVIVKEFVLSLWRQWLNSIDNRTFFPKILMLPPVGTKQVDVKRVDKQTGFGDRKHRLITTPACRAGHCRLEVKNGNLKKLTLTDPGQ